MVFDRRSDAGIYSGTNAAATYPRIIGHEIVGEVVECGPTAKKVKVGDRVIIDQVTACGHCYACTKDSLGTLIGVTGRVLLDSALGALRQFERNLSV